MAFQLDATANEIRVFLDGAFAASTPSTALEPGQVRAMIDQTRVMAVRATLPCPDSLTLGIALTLALDALHTAPFKPSALSCVPPHKPLITVLVKHGPLAREKQTST